MRKRKDTGFSQPRETERNKENLKQKTQVRINLTRSGECAQKLQPTIKLWDKSTVAKVQVSGVRVSGASVPLLKTQRISRNDKDHSELQKVKVGLAQSRGTISAGRSFNLLRWSDVPRASRTFCPKIATFSQS